MSNKQKRYRGIILTSQGLRKLQENILLLEEENNEGKRSSLEQLSELTQLSSATIRKVLNQDCLVDKNTIRIFFQTFGLELLSDDYEKPKSEILGQEENNQQDWGLAPDIANFYGQENNIATLTDWIVEKHCNLILLLGMGGSGKTFLSITGLWTKLKEIKQVTLRQTKPETFINKGSVFNHIMSKNYSGNNSTV